MKRGPGAIFLVAAVCLPLGVLAAYFWNDVRGDSGVVVPTASAAKDPAPMRSQSPITPTPSATALGFDRELFSLDEPDSLWVVVNKARPLDPATFEPSVLDELSAIPGGSDQWMVPEASRALVEMYGQMETDGVPLRVATAYRSHAYQSEIFDEYVAVWGREHTETLVARPGHTEHQTGLAVDLYAAQECRVKECFAQEATYAWLVANAADYGFVERYPADGQAVTGYQFEPWHWRYVGVELARETTSRGVTTLEEFFELPAAPDYVD